MSWTRDLTLTKTGKCEATIENVRIIMENDRRLKGRYFYDTFKERMTVCGDLPWIKLSARLSNAWNDVDDAGLRNYIEKRYSIANVSKIVDAVALAMLKCSRHPVREYLEGLTWDGTPRADTIFIDYLGAEDTEYTRTVKRKALIGAVARVMQTGCKHGHILVLVGPQGCRKSTTLAKLGKSWFSDSFYTVQGKEAYEQLQGFWLIEMGEMAATRKAELEQIKQFVSKQSDSYRAAYARRTQERPRQCAFFGTTNDDEFLRGARGGRRVWPDAVAGEGGSAVRLRSWVVGAFRHADIGILPFAGAFPLSAGCGFEARPAPPYHHQRKKRSARTSSSGKRDSNPRPSAWEADALPTELFPHYGVQSYSVFFICQVFGG